MRDPECSVGPGSPQVAGLSRGDATPLPAAGAALPYLPEAWLLSGDWPTPPPGEGWPWGLPSRVQLEKGTDRVRGHLGA